MGDTTPDLSEFGGVRLSTGYDGTEHWLFGWRNRPGLVDQLLGTLPRPTFAEACPHLAGSWDGQSVSLWDATKIVLGDYLPAQKQTRGTCVSRGYSAACNVLQCVQIATGKRSDAYRPVAHAPIYGGSRQLAGILGPSDGSIGVYAGKWVSTRGLIHQGECEDRSYDNDQLAVAWGLRGVPDTVAALGGDNLVKDVTLVTAAQQAADLIANGYPIPVCSDQGFTMERDAAGVCRPRGTWMHCMYFAAVVTLPDGRRVFGCGQSWGTNVPSGPALWHCPDNVFGVEWDVADRMLRQRDSMALSGLEGWPAQTLDWRH